MKPHRQHPVLQSQPPGARRRFRRRDPRWAIHLAVVMMAFGLVLTATAGVSAQERGPAGRATVAGTCADLGLSVVEPDSVQWEAAFDPPLNPNYLWAYGDPELLVDDATDEYWFHWYDAVPGPDAYVVYQFDAPTTIQAVQFTNDWSSGDLEIQGIDGSGQAVSPPVVAELDDPFQSHVAEFNPVTASKIKLTTTTQQVKLLEVDFCGGAAAPTDPDPTDTDPTDPDPTEPAPDCGPDNDVADEYCDSVKVIDSFGDARLPAGADSGMQWNTVRSYYAAFGGRSGMCDIDIHNSYWTAVRSTDGTLVYYPSWHPPVHDLGGPDECRFTHEHGLDPRSSDLYDEAHPTNVGVPFGFVHPGTGGVSGRVEDHVGHKVVVENNLQLTLNNPYSEGTALQLFEPNGQPVTCDWYSKLHQGTHSVDALGFNLHEYYLNYSCDDGTEVRIKEMTDFGFETPGTSVVDGPSFTLTGGSGTVASDCGWFATNLPAPGIDPDPSGDSDFGDAKRGFTCLMNDAKIEELWKASAYLSAPDGAATIKFDPYYVVMNSNRYALYEWWEYLEQDGDHVGENANISMVDFCVDGSELRNELARPDAPNNFVKAGANYGGEFRVGTYCDLIDSSVRDHWAQDIVAAGGDNAALMAERKHSVDNVFLGTRRGVHTKGPVMYGSKANIGPLAFFCSDHLGNNASWPTNPNTGAPVTPASPWSSADPVPVCTAGVAQLLSSFNNGHGPVEGSTAGATVTNGDLIANGPAGEIIIDIDALYPSHGIQAPN